MNQDRIPVKKRTQSPIQTEIEETEAAQLLVKAQNVFEPTVLLTEYDLWNQFNQLGTEMIITKQGRCLFPALRFRFLNLKPTGMYRIGIDFELVGGKKKFKQGKGWESVPSDERGLLRGHTWFPNEWQSGNELIKSGTSFQQLKLTNRSVDSPGMFTVSSFHMYRPRLHILEKGESILHYVFTFKQCDFVAVTHYQNDFVNSLKKSSNPHAKGFKDVEFHLEEYLKHAEEGDLVIKEIVRIEDKF